jgi:hypothetical protein
MKEYFNILGRGIYIFADGACDVPVGLLAYQSISFGVGVSFS